MLNLLNFLKMLKTMLYLFISILFTPSLTKLNRLPSNSIALAVALHDPFLRGYVNEVLLFYQI